MSRGMGAWNLAIAGFTLVEVMVVLILLGVTAGIAAMSVGLSARGVVTQAERLDEARDSAARYGISVTVPIDSSGVSAVLLVLPDGRVIGAESELMADVHGRSAR